MSDFVRLNPKVISEMMEDIGKNIQPQDILIAELEREDPALYRYVCNIAPMYARDIIRGMGIKDKLVKRRLVEFLVEQYLLGSAETRGLLKRQYESNGLEKSLGS